MSALKPGTFTKGDSTKVADTAADAVALAYDGYTRVDDATDEQLEAGSVESEQAGADTGAEGDVSTEDEVDTPLNDVDDNPYPQF